MSDRHTPPLSVIIITHRQDQRFHQCLATVQFAPEIIVVTPPGPITDFARERNQALAKATQPWVLFIDSDEVLTPSSITTLNKLTSQTKVKAFWIKREDYFLGQKLKWGEVGSHWQLRLGQRNAIRFSRPIHEQTQVQGTSQKSALVIKHFPHPSIDQFLSKIINYSTQEAEYRYSIQQRFHIWQLMLPFAKFIFNYFLKLGFLDGFRGLTYALIMSIHSLSVRSQLYEKNVAA